MTEKLWLVIRKGAVGESQYDSFVCAASDEAAARNSHPAGSQLIWVGEEWKYGSDYAWNGDAWKLGNHLSDKGWPAPADLIVQELGTADEGVVGVQCASFNA